MMILFDAKSCAGIKIFRIVVFHSCVSLKDGPGSEIGYTRWPKRLHMQRRGAFTRAGLVIRPSLGTSRGPMNRQYDTALWRGSRDNAGEISMGLHAGAWGCETDTREPHDVLSCACSRSGGRNPRSINVGEG